MNVGPRCLQLTPQGGHSVQVTKIPQLLSHPEEADTRLFLHAHHAVSTGESKVTLRSPDTDVAVIGLWAAGRIPCQLHLETGSGKTQRVFSITETAHSLDQDLCNALPVAIARRPELQRSDVRVFFFRTAQHSESYAYYKANTMTWL